MDLRICLFALPAEDLHQPSDHFIGAVLIVKLGLNPSQGHDLRSQFLSRHHMLPLQISDLIVNLLRAE